MTSKTFNHWHLQSTANVVSRPTCAKQAATTTKVYFRGLCIDGDDGP
jgi:hypothetical protein